MTAAWERFRADEEWREIKRTAGPRPMVGAIEDRPMALADYSPGPF